MKRLLLITLIGMISLGSSAQQDRHYSMFYASPMSLNPAATGFFEGKAQFFAGYRNQWRSISADPYTTVSACMDGKVLESKLNGGFLGIGMTFYNDKAGPSRLTSNIYSFNINYALELAKNQKLAIGIQPGFLQRYIGNTNLTWDEQWNGNAFDQNLQSGEYSTFQRSSQFDIGAGIYYTANLTDRNSLYIGASATHLLQPSFSLINVPDDLYRKYIFHAGGELGGNHSKFNICPNLLVFTQGPNREISIGTDFKYFLKESSKYTGYYGQSSISVGTYLRLNDAFYTTFFFNTSGFSFGLSYDLNLSKLSLATQGRGGVEMVLRYRISGSNNSSSSF